MTAGIDFDPAEREAVASEMNLSVLKRSDSAIQSVLKSASHVAVYKLQEDVHEWQRCDIEGSLVIVERDMKKSIYPDRTRHRIVIINRKSPENYSDDIVVGNKELEQTEQMIMYNNPQGTTMGIWFYDREEAVAIFDLLQKIVSGQVIQKPPQPARSKRTNKRSSPSNRSAGKQKNPQGKPAGQKGREPKSTAEASQGAADAPKATADACKPTTDASMSAAGATQSTAEASKQEVNPLERFFPNLKLTDGVAGEALPANAQDSTEFERNAATPFKPTASIDQAIVHASTEGMPDVNAIESGVVKATSEAPKGTAAAKPTPKATSKLPNKASSKTGRRSPGKATGKLSGKSSGKTAGRPAGRAPSPPMSSAMAGAPLSSMAFAASASAPAIARPPVSQSFAGTKESGETQRLMQAQAQAMMHAQNMKMQEARFREMQAYRFGSGGEMGPGQAPTPPLMGGAPPPPLPLPHFGGVHPQMAMMMHQRHQMYMHQYMANVQQQQHHQRQMHMQGGIGQVPGAGEGRSPRGEGSATIGEEPAKDLMRMLKVDGAESAGGGPSSEDTALRVAGAMVTAGRNGELGTAKWGELDRDSFRAVIQRMLTDRKLFDSVYEHYARTAKE